MSDLVGNPEDRFSQNEAHLASVTVVSFSASRDMLRWAAHEENRAIQVNISHVRT